LYDTMCEIVKEDATFNSIYTRKRKNNVTLLIVIGGDRGLAGGFNANVLKLAQSRYDELSVNSEVVILPIGRKAVEYFEKRNFRIMTRYENISESISIYGAMSIADKIIDVYNKDKIDRVELFYTDCISPLVQEEKHIPIIPLDIEVDRSNVSLTNYEPSPEAVFDSLIPRYIAGVLFGAIVDSFAAEQAARRTAMENATDNANEMISNLSLVYNRARQAAITQEITEIVSGANAQE
ncbi:ATP synthase F1 subunit gamma, partial [Porcipelethomonas sp.]